MGSDKIKGIIIEEKFILSIPDEWGWSIPVEHIKIESFANKSENKDNKLYGMYYLWKNIDSPYVCINWGEILPRIEKEQWDKIERNETKMLLAKSYCSNKLQEVYREQYYGFDFRLMLSYLKKFEKEYYEYAKEEVLNQSELLFPAGVFEKNIFNEICKWMFSIFKQLEKLIPHRFSTLQNSALDHLAPYLFTIYVKKHFKKEEYEVSVPQVLNVENKGIPTGETPSPESSSYDEIVDYIKNCMNLHQVEKAAQIALQIPTERQELQYVAEAFRQYDRERRYYDLTTLDKTDSWENIYKNDKKNLNIRFEVKKQKPKMLVFQWNSVGHNVNVRALRSFGFECHTIQVPYDRNQFDEDCLEQLNCHLDRNSFDVVFSLNCIGMVAEACYVHNIPYIAWCYDSPSFVGAQWYLKYPTTHVFLFDSDDARHYREAGIKQAHYMPLAVNLEYFNTIKSTEADRRKYKADISFVGSLYESNLPKAMNYLTDYQKGYLNALMDTQLDIYGCSLFDSILSPKLMEWLSTPEFNKLLNIEWEKDKENEEVVSAGRLKIALNKQTTNKERLLLLNLFAKYYKVNLYSYKSSEALKNLNFCGTVDYYTEMPKVFQNSRINLNASLRSIVNGIPLRCLDIMGCHGLLLTNYQKDFDDHFEDEKNLLFFTCAEEALEKAKFYLEHEDLRVKIAEAGYETVKQYYDYPVKLSEIFHMDGLDYLIPQKGV